MPPEEKALARMIVSVPFGGDRASRVAEGFRVRGFEVAEVMDIVGSLVVVGPEDAVREAAAEIPEVIGVEPEQILRALE